MQDQGIYRGGASQQDINCSVTLAEHKVYLYFKDRLPEMLIWDLNALASCRFVGDTVYLIKDEVPGQSLSCSGIIARQIYKAWQDPPLEKPKSLRKVKSFFVVCALGIVALGVLFYLYAIPWIAGKTVGFVSKKMEIQLGNQLSEVYLQEDQVNDSATYYANAFAQKINFNTQYPIHIYVIRSPEINAFAVPGGNIFIYTGLLDKLTAYEELTALLGHESTHIIKRHSLKSMMRSAASGLIISAVFGDMDGMSNWVLSKADGFKQLDYSRALETEADLEGLKLMQENKVNPKGMLQLLEILKKESGEMPALMKYLSTHPDTDARIEAVATAPEIKNVFAENEKLKSIFMRLKKSL